MPFILSSPAAAPPASPGTRAPARSSDQDPNAPGSFGEAMTRSREAGQEKAAEPAVRTAPSKQARRPAEAEKRPAQDTADPLAALPVPLLENRLAAGALPPGSAPAAENPVAPADAALGDPLATTPVAPGGLAGATGIVVDANVQAVLASVTRPVGAKGDDRAPVQARDAAASSSVAMDADPRAIAAQADATSAGLSDPSSGQDEPTMNMASALGKEAVELSLESPDTTPDPGTGQWVVPAGAALQQPGSLSASNAPSPVAAAMLTPDIGSSEWGKALGQQVTHLSTADQQVAELQLNPPGLGPLKVTLSLVDQQMQAAFVSAHASVRAAVEAALPQLRIQLAESGISLGQTSVGSESQPQTAFANGQEDSSSPSPRASLRSRDADMAALFFTPPVAVQRRPGHGLRIDTYA